MRSLCSVAPDGRVVGRLLDRRFVSMDATSHPGCDWPAPTFEIEPRRAAEFRMRLDHGLWPIVADARRVIVGAAPHKRGTPLGHRVLIIVRGLDDLWRGDEVDLSNRTDEVRAGRA